MSIHRVYSLIAVLVGCSLVSANAAAQDRSVRRIGIVVSLTVNMTPAEGRELAAALGAALQRDLPIEVIAGQETERRMPPQGVPEDCVAEPACRQDLGRRLDADELLLVVMVRLGQEIQIDTTWANVSSGRVMSRPALTITSDGDANKVFSNAASSLLPHIARAQPATSNPPKIIVVQPTTERSASNRHFTAGTLAFAGVSAAALLGGTIFALSAQRKYNSLQDLGCATMMCPQDDIDRLGRHALTADILFGTALASGVVAAVLYWRSDTGAKPVDAGTKPASSVGLKIGPEGASVVLGGAF